MYRLELTDAEEQTLEHTFKTTTDRRLRDRCQAVLMVARGRRRYEVARDLGVHRATLGKWLNSYREGGVEGLVIQWSPGKARRIGDELASRIIEWVQRRAGQLRVKPRELDLRRVGALSLSTDRY